MDNELCKCGKVGKISCPHDDRCGIDNTQLPAEVLEKIHTDTNLLYDQLDEAAREVDFYEFGLPQSDRQTEPIRNLITEYASKLHEARTLLEKFIFRHEGGLLPDRLLYNDIKTFLDGKK